MSEVWIVDDDAFYQNYLAMYLNSTGYATRCFSTGEECLAVIAQKPMAILLDHNLGTPLNGVDFLRLIKEIDPSIPVISISGSDRSEIISDSFRSGSEDFVLKDSASLIRLKIQLEKLLAASKQDAQNKKSKRVLVYIIATIALIVVVVAILAKYVAG
jgi:DNA-binding NtrC family response regulator